MKRLVSLLMLMVLFLSACGSPATATPPTQEPGGFTATPTSPPPTPTHENTTTPTPEPTATPTATPVPPQSYWFWSVDAASLKVVGTDQFGAHREFDALNAGDALNTDVFLLGPEQALLFVMTDGLELYLLTPDGMQPFSLGDSLNGIRTNADTNQLELVASNPGHAVFSLLTERGYGSMPDNGPIFWVDLANRVVNRIDDQVSRSYIGVHRRWFHASLDGRYLRYLSGPPSTLNIRELDLESGLARTLITLNDFPYQVQASPEGDLWYAHSSGLIIDLNGNQTAFSEAGMFFLPLRNGLGVVLPTMCADNCQVKVISPFGNQPEQVYQVPWGIAAFYVWPEITQVLPDQSLLIPGTRGRTLGSNPALMLTDPSFTPDSAPLFRLTPDGGYTVLGLFNKIDSMVSFTSPDNRYTLLQAVDKTSYFIYDTQTGQTLFSIPTDQTQQDAYPWLSFYQNGVFVDLSTIVNQEYLPYFAAYHYETDRGAEWNGEVFKSLSCQTMLEDGTLICWFESQSNPGVTVDLVRYDPASGMATPLLENVWYVQTFQ